ncbi:ABC transporter permease [Gammaproteobacteria bacterium]|nr:ABC transporter permease [Gammaproteobacteria bacterium]
MFTSLQLHLAKVFLKIFLRDRQSIVFTLLFPLIFTGVFLFSSGEPDPIKLGLINQSQSTIAADFSDLVIDEPLFEITQGDLQSLRQELINGDQTALILIPTNFKQEEDSTQITLLLDASQVRQAGAIEETLNRSLISIEREIRGIEPMFNLEVEDVQARPQRYIDFLLPGILAYMLMNLCIAGSGFNVVEYRRRGILKRLFVTPIQAKDFIVAIIISRMVIILTQISVILGLALTLLDIRIAGSLASLYGMVIIGTFIFLCIGFFLGSLAKTQEAIRPIVALTTFPQLILSGVFFPISALHELLQPIAHALPLSVIVSGLRGISNNGASLLSFNLTTIGILIWMAISFFIATKYFVWKEVAN